jgi:hypothetical protein
VITTSEVDTQPVIFLNVSFPRLAASRSELEPHPSDKLTRYATYFSDGLGRTFELFPFTFVGVKFTDVSAISGTGRRPVSSGSLNLGFPYTYDASGEPDFAEAIFAFYGMDLFGGLATASLNAVDGISVGATVPGDKPKGLLEFPSADVQVGGIGSFTGWICYALDVAISIDGGEPIPVGYGTARGDTADVCGDTNNGFAMLVNWALLGEGRHEAVLLADGEEIDRQTFRVVSLGTTFLRGEEPTCTVQDFAGRDVTIQFREASQSAMIVAAD